MLSVLENRKLHIYCRLRGIINQYQDFTIQTIFTYYLYKDIEGMDKPLRILENSIKKPKSNTLPLPFLVIPNIYNKLDVLYRNLTKNDSILYLGINLIEPLVKLLKGTIKQKEKPDRVDIILDIPFCGADENFFLNLKGSNKNISKAKRDPLILTKFRSRFTTHKYFWGRKEDEEEGKKEEDEEERTSENNE